MQNSVPVNAVRQITIRTVRESGPRRLREKGV